MAYLEEFKSGQTVEINGHQWLVDNVLAYCPTKGRCLQVRAVTQLRFTVRSPNGATGWQTSFWVK